MQRFIKPTGKYVERLNNCNQPVREWLLPNSDVAITVGGTLNLGKVTLKVLEISSDGLLVEVVSASA
jgi:hypothetical protein